MNYEVVLTYKCNWNCEYCAVDTHNNHISLGTAFEKIKNIPSNSNVTLSGGELGLLKREFLTKVISFLQSTNCKISINTNGLLLRRYPDLLEYFEEITYHCSEDLNLDDEIYITDHNIKYLLVVHDENINKLKDFLDKNSEILFCIVPATTPITGIKGSPELSKENRLKILKEYGTRITNESKLDLLNGKDYSCTVFI